MSTRLQSSMERQSSPRQLAARQVAAGRDWRVVDAPCEVPQQDNGIDCGVFACLNAVFALQRAREKWPVRATPDRTSASTSL